MEIAGKEGGSVPSCLRRLTCSLSLYSVLLRRVGRNHHLFGPNNGPVPFFMNILHNNPLPIPKTARVSENCAGRIPPAYRRRRGSRNPNSFSALLLLFVANDAAIYHTLFNDERQNSIERDSCGSEVESEQDGAKDRYHHEGVKR